MTIPATMRRARFNGAGGPEVIAVEVADVPRSGPQQVLIEVHAAGINRPDCLQRGGKYPPPPGATDIPGLEIAGRIVAVGDGVSSDHIGRSVCALTISGGYAEYAVAELPLCLPVPQGFSMLEAGGIPENYFTVYDNVFTRGRLKKGETILIHGGSSGIGSTAIQLAREARARVFATAGTDEKCQFCKGLGAEAAINYRAADFVDEVKRLTDKRGVDVILDMVGGTYIPKNVSILATEGRLVQIAFLQSPIAELNFQQMMIRRLTLTGSTLRPRSVALKSAIAEGLARDVWPLFESGKIRPVIDAVFPLAEARKAHEMMEASSHTGKIMLNMR